MVDNDTFIEHAIPVSVIMIVAVIVLRTPDFFDLRKQFTFYASYHHNTINQLIHILCVWPIFFTSLIFFAYTPPVSEFLHLFNYSFIVAVIYASYYALIEPIMGLSSLCVLVCWVCANLLRMAYAADAWKYALYVHIIAWVVQFIGHGFFERRAPALFENLAQSVIMAPLFVLLEVVFYFGYNKKFAQMVNQDVLVKLKMLDEKPKKCN